MIGQGTLDQGQGSVAVVKVKGNTPHSPASSMRKGEAGRSAQDTYNRGMRFYRSEGVAGLALGCDLFKVAADQGHAGAQHMSGVCLTAGLGVPQDYALAAKYFRLAVDQGFAASQCSLAQLDLHGMGVPQDYAEGARFHRLAADQGHSPSQLALGAMIIDDEHSSAEVRALEPVDPAAGARLLASASQSPEPAFEPYRVQALGILQAHADVREVAAACCNGCGKPDGLMQCTRCHVARFCGAACMKQMWPSHKQSCKRWREEGGGDKSPGAMSAAASRLASPERWAQAASDGGSWHGGFTSRSK